MSAQAEKSWSFVYVYQIVVVIGRKTGVTRKMVKARYEMMKIRGSEPIFVGHIPFRFGR